MGSKYALLPFLHGVLAELEFDTVVDAFAGSGCVAYLLKAMGKRVLANDFLNLGATVAAALVENPGIRLSAGSLAELLRPAPHRERFIEKTFGGIFFRPEDLRFLDLVSWNLQALENRHERALAMAALIRSCLKRQPRGVFTVAGSPERYDDGRRDLKLSLREHFLEQAAVYNSASFANGRANRARHGDVFELAAETADLVYLDPPYVPRADDNCYVKRYHFVEGLSCYWRGLTIRHDTKVRKIEKRFTPFSSRRTALPAFDRLFGQFADSIQVLSYSSNAYPDLPVLLELMGRYKRRVEVHEHAHRYHFGTHAAARRRCVSEFLIVGT